MYAVDIQTPSVVVVPKQMKRKEALVPASAMALPWTVRPQFHHHLMHPALQSAHHLLPGWTTQSSHSGFFP